MSAPRVGLDAIAIRTGGGVAFLAGLLPALARVWPEARLALWARPEVVGLVEVPDGVTVDAVRAPRGALRVLWERRRAPRWAAQRALDVLLAAADAGPTRAPCAFVQVAQNAKIYRDRSWRYRALAHAARATAAGARATVFVSEALRAVAGPVLHARAEAVIPHGVRPPPAGPFPAPLDRPYVLVVATPYAHKDLATAHDAVRRLRASGRPECLVVVGAGGDAAVNADLRTRAAAEPGSLVLAGAASAAELEPWYAHASALMLPSREESSGMPVAEALARGVPVVASDVAALRETAAGGARHHRVGDVDGAAAALRAALSAPGSAASRRESGRRYGATRTWEAAARRYREVLEGALR